ncbi:MAG: hypothetical protein ACFFD2_27015, partial [Promethearchaeota archaeon]
IFIIALLCIKLTPIGDENWPEKLWKSTPRTKPLMIRGRLGWEKITHLNRMLFYARNLVYFWKNMQQGRHFPRIFPEIPLPIKRKSSKKGYEEIPGKRSYCYTYELIYLKWHNFFDYV